MVPAKLQSLDEKLTEEIEQIQTLVIGMQDDASGLDGLFQQANQTKRRFRKETKKLSSTESSWMARLELLEEELAALEEDWIIFWRIFCSNASSSTGVAAIGGWWGQLLLFDWVAVVAVVVTSCRPGAGIDAAKAPGAFSLGCTTTSFRLPSLAVSVSGAIGTVLLLPVAKEGMLLVVERPSLCLSELMSVSKCGRG